MATFKTLFDFNDDNGAYPQSALVADAHGNLFGTTGAGGLDGSSGTVFEIPYTDGSYATAPIVLAGIRSPGLLIDPNGNLFGVMQMGVFEIPYANGSYAAPTTVSSFSGASGASGPQGPLIENAAGDLFGATSGGGPSNGGTVYEVPYANGSYTSTTVTLASFNGPAGDGPAAGLIADAAGDLFGTTVGGGTNNDGTVFEIPYTNGHYASTPTTLVEFGAASAGKSPRNSLTMDAAGKLFGTTSAGGTNDYGTVFEIPYAKGHYADRPGPLQRSGRSIAFGQADPRSCREFIWHNDGRACRAGGARHFRYGLQNRQ